MRQENPALITTVGEATPRTHSADRTMLAVRGWVRPMRVALLLTVDTLLLGSTALAAILFWAIRVHHQPLSLYLDLVPVLALFLLSYARAELYPGFGLGAVEILRRLSLSTSFVFVFLAAGSFLLKTPHLYSRMTFALAWAGSLVLVPAGRLLFLTLMQRFSWWGEPAVVVGRGQLARRTVESLRGALSLGYRPRWWLPIGSEEEDISGLRTINALDDAEELARRGVRVVLVADAALPRAEDLVDLLQRRFRHVIMMRGREGEPIEGVVIRNMGGVLGLEFRNNLLRLRHRLLKRALDLLVGGVGLLLALPVLAVAIVALKLSSRGPAFFCQEREGRAGRRIRLWKLRTMHADAERRLEDHLAESDEARAEWDSRFKLTRDPRIIPGIGSFLRRFSVDELPQLWNVIKGEMSLVGPRPFPEYHLSRFSSRFRDLRRQVRPGLTGLWQVQVRSDGGVKEQELFDTYYIRNWSLWMDLYVLGRTTLTVLTGQGAY